MPALKTQLWISALLRRANLAGAYSTIARKGDEERGDVLIRVYAQMGIAHIYGRTFSPDGEDRFRRLPEGSPAETEADCAAYIQKRLQYDTDLWVVDIEDRDGRHFLTEPVEDD